MNRSLRYALRSAQERREYGDFKFPEISSTARRGLSFGSAPGILCQKESFARRNAFALLVAAVTENNEVAAKLYASNRGATLIGLDDEHIRHLQETLANEVREYGSRAAKRLDRRFGAEVRELTACIRSNCTGHRPSGLIKSYVDKLMLLANRVGPLNGAGAYEVVVKRDDELRDLWLKRKDELCYPSRRSRFVLDLSNAVLSSQATYTNFKLTDEVVKIRVVQDIAEWADLTVGSADCCRFGLAYHSAEDLIRSDAAAGLLTFANVANRGPRTTTEYERVITTQLSRYLSAPSLGNLNKGIANLLRFIERQNAAQVEKVALHLAIEAPQDSIIEHERCSLMELVESQAQKLRLPKRSRLSHEAKKLLYYAQTVNLEIGELLSCMKPGSSLEEVYAAMAEVQSPHPQSLEPQAEAARVPGGRIAKHLVTEAFNDTEIRNANLEILFLVLPDRGCPMSDWLEDTAQSSIITQVISRLAITEAGALGYVRAMRRNLRDTGIRELKMRNGTRMYLLVEPQRVIVLMAGTKDQQERDCIAAVNLRDKWRSGKASLRRVTISDGCIRYLEKTNGKK